MGKVLISGALGEDLCVRAREEAQNLGVQCGARCADSDAHLALVVDAVAQYLLEHSGSAVLDEERQEPCRASGLVRDDGVEERLDGARAKGARRVKRVNRVT